MLFTYISPYSKIKKSSNADSTGRYTIRKRTGHFKRTSILFRDNFFDDTPQTYQDPGAHLCRAAIGCLGVCVGQPDMSSLSQLPRITILGTLERSTGPDPRILPG